MHDTTRWMETDFYEVLGVPATADSSEIARAYRRRARDHHPDLNPAGDADDFNLVQEAYETLGSSTTRERYDEVRTYGLISTRCYPHAEPDDDGTDSADLWIRPYADRMSYARNGFQASASYSTAYSAAGWSMTWASLNPWGAFLAASVRPRRPS